MRRLVSLAADVFQRLLGKLAFIAPGGGSVRPWLHRLRGARLGKNVWIGEFVYIDAPNPEALSVGDNCTIEHRTSIITHLYRGPRRLSSRASVVIANDVLIGPHCVILPHVRIGEGAVIRAGTVVSTNVPARALWGPPPAGILAEVTIPATPPRYTYEDFLRGLRPVRKTGRKSEDAESHDTLPPESPLPNSGRGQP